MKIVVVCGRAARQPWTAGGLAARVCADLRRRGHVVDVVAQSIDDATAFAGCASVHVFDTFDQTATDWPLGFAMWARSRVRTIERDVCLSFSRTVAGDVWMPLEPSGAAWFGRARGTLGLKSQAIALARHHGFARAWATDLLRVYPSGPRIRRVVAIGAQSAGEAARLLHRARGLGERVATLEPFSSIVPPEAADRQRLRGQVREALGLDADRVVIVAFAPMPVGGRMDALFLALAELQARDRQRAPELIVAAKDCVALHTRALRCGADQVCRIVPLTERADALLMAADVLALPAKTDMGVFVSGGLSRGAADGLRLGMPIIAAGGASGYELARWRSSQQDAPGLVIDVPSVDAWARALKQAMDPAWRDRASAAAHELGKTMTFGRFCDDLADVLERAAEERRADPEDERGVWDALLSRA
ncbi:MAG: hypothetical protein K2W85_13055 [Phycisphaerales bacterium]|nr:hypothetical protein [Phycisphaerales bacterium]